MMNKTHNWTISGKVVIVTGANTGIGKVSALELVKRGAARVILACRNLQAAEEAALEIRQKAGLSLDERRKVVVRHLDLASLTSVRCFAAEILATEKQLHVLINNAGIAGPNKRLMTEDGYEMTFQVNHLGHFLLTNLLLELIKRSAPSRIINVASDGYHFCRPNGLRVDDLFYEKRIFHPLLAYCQSKLCNILHARRLNHILNGVRPGHPPRSGVAVFTLNPGKVDTEIMRHRSALLQFLSRKVRLIWVSPEQGARTTLMCACDAGIESYSGGFWDKEKLVKTYSIAEDDAKARALWELSEEMCISH